MRYIIYTIFILFSCDKTPKSGLVQYQGGRQFLSLNRLSSKGEKISDFNVGKISPDSIFLGEEFVVRIYLTNRDAKLVGAFVDCQALDNPTADTAVYPLDDDKRLDGCETQLLVQNDTLFIGFVPTTAGKKTFEEITLLTRDKENIFRTQKYTFEYNVVRIKTTYNKSYKTYAVL